MLNTSRMKVYINAYTVRLEHGESLEEIDKDYLDLKRLTKDEINKINRDIEVTAKKVTESENKIVELIFYSYNFLCHRLLIFKKLDFCRS